MSNEIAYVSAMKVRKGLLSLDAGSDIVKYATLNGSHYIEGSLSLTDTYESIVKGDVGTLGMAYFENVGPSNVDINSGLTGLGLISIKVGEGHLMRLGPGFQNPAAKAADAAGTAELKFTIVED
jgi:hypothetical protein